MGRARAILVAMCILTVPAVAESYAAAAPSEFSAQSRPPTRFRVYPPGGRLLYRDCVFRLVQEVRPGGTYPKYGAVDRDYTLVMGVVIYYASFVIMLNLLADILYAALDPRVRLGQ